MTARTLLAAITATLAIAAPAAAAPESIFGGAVPCTAADGYVQCAGIVESFDGAPIDVNVAFPADQDGPLPLLGTFHGWGGSKLGFGSLKGIVGRGYVAFTMSDRGWGNSCGGQDPKRLSAACADGYNHLMDTRYEVRDYQELAGRLVDEGLVRPRRIGATGGSYGGGISMALAALKDRIMLPDGSYAPWRSPAGADMELAAAAPSIPWTDLAYSLVPTGRNLDYVADNPYGDRGGVMKQSFVSGLFALGLAGSNYAAPGQDPDADLFTWYGLTSAGEPYDDNPLLLDAVDELTSHHSSYYIEPDREPAPLLINNGFTDDLFPVSEAVRFYNRTRARFPGAKIAMYHMDNGHQRGQNKAADTARLRQAQDEWLDHYLLGEGEEPFQGVRALTIACGEPSEGPYAAPSWRTLSPGEVRHHSKAGPKTIVSPGSPLVSRAFDPIAGGGACAQTPSKDQAGTATYRLPIVGRDGGYTILGSPTFIARVSAPSPHAAFAARLLDINRSGERQRLIARGLFRPDASGRQVFQLHPTGWRVKQGHRVKLELLAADVPYGRIGNGSGPVTVSKIEIRLPVAEGPGDAISAPEAKVVPKGSELAFGYRKFQRRALRRAR